MENINKNANIICILIFIIIWWPITIFDGTFLKFTTHELANAFFPNKNFHFFQCLSLEGILLHQTII